MTTFVDRVELHVAAGSGGHGCASVHREKFKPLGGPDGGNGGRGGDVILVVDQSVTTLLDYHHSPHRKATNGKPGEGGNRSGKDGQDLVLPVPDGTVDPGQGGERARRPGRPGHHVRRRPGRPRRPRQRGAGLGPPQGARLRAARRARRPPGHRPGAEDGRGRGARRLPERRQVLADLGAVGRQAEDRGLPVHHPRPEPGRGDGRLDRLHDRGRAGPDPGRQPGQGPRPGVPAPRRALQRARARPGHGDPGVRPRPGLRPRHHRGGAEAVRRPRTTGRASSSSTRSTYRTARTSPRWSGRIWRRAATRSSRSRRWPTRACKELSFALADLVAKARAAKPKEEATRIVIRPEGGRRRRLHRGRRRRTACSACGARSPSAGCGRPTSATTRPSATSPTGSTASVWRTR